MEKRFLLYLLCWMSFCVIAIAIAIYDRTYYSSIHRKYLKYLFKPWKVVTFFTGGVSLILIAPHSGDPTWDFFDATIMSLLTFFTAPWAIGVFYKSIKREANVKQFIVSICAWLFSASWSYDLYLLIRDGVYPDTWQPNLFASSILYIMAGLLWNLEWREKRGTIFGFMEKDWPSSHQESSFMKVFWFTLPFILIVAFLFVSSIVDLKGIMRHCGFK